MGVGKKITTDDLRQPHGCAYTLWLTGKWKLKAESARKKYARWALDKVTLYDQIQRPGAWMRAVAQAQKAYPGTASWLMSCSRSEGGWGRWVPNSQGSGAGGWLQFMHGTFSGFNRHALEDVKRRGFSYPASARSWYSPLGQALAGAWGYRHGLSYHWYGGGC